MTREEIEGIVERGIEEIAIKRMGMVRPPKENVVTVKRKSDTTSSQIPNSKLMSDDKN